MRKDASIRKGAVPAPPPPPPRGPRSIAELRPGMQGRLTSGHVFEVRRPAAEVSAEGEKVLAVMITGPAAKGLVDVFHRDINWDAGVGRPF